MNAKACGRPRCKAVFTCVKCGAKRCAHLIRAGRIETLTGVCRTCSST